MKYLILCVVALCASCVTSGDLRDVAAQVETIERSLGDPTKSVAEVERDVAAAKAEIGAIAKRVEDRSESLIRGIDDGAAGGGLIGIASAVALNLYRNRQRRRRDEPVTPEEAKAKKAA